MLKQIEVLENGFFDCVEEMDGESQCNDSFSSFLKDEDKIDDSNGNIKPMKSLKSINNKESHEIDFSDVTELFNRTRTKSLENENYQDFLAIMQHFCLIPTNENGKKIWKKIREALEEMNSLGKDGKTNKKFINFLELHI